MANLKMKPVGNLLDALVVRRLRNSCAEFMTNYQNEIGFIEQIRWYLRVYRKRSRSGEYRVFLFSDLSGEFIGYGTLQLHEGRLYCSVGLGTQYRGKGYGTVIMQALVDVAKREDRDMVAEIWSTNIASQKMVMKCGFVLHEEIERDRQNMQIYHLKTNS